MRLAQGIAQTLGGFSFLDSMTEGEEAYYLVYGNTNQERVLNRYLKDGFQHVSVLYFNGYHWMEIQGTWSSLDFNSVSSIDGFVFSPYENLARVYKAKGYTVQKVNKNYTDKLRVPSLLAPFTCVEIAKAVLGISKFSVFTPYQLYKYIGGLNGNH